MANSKGVRVVGLIAERRTAYLTARQTKSVHVVNQALRMHAAS